MDGKETKKKLIDKYEIPLNHLDFAYIGECENAREIEKILQILRSGEEGYFPDLTTCAENKLRELKPNSRLFRYEEKLQGREALSKQEWKPIFDWTNNIKAKDVELSAAAEKMAKLDLGVPPVRKSGAIKQCVESNELKAKQSGGVAAPTSKISTERIKSTDYQKWDKYDAEEECLRMELAEERVQEEVERKNLLNKQKSKLQTESGGSTTAADTKTVKEQDVLSKFTDVERERLAEEYRLRGNDYFRAKEYQNAIKEYDRAINVCAEKAAPAYNNRAAAKIKLKWYTEAIKDCQQCLQLEPDNLKARLRLADATYANGERQESHALYMKVLELDPENVNALKTTAQLKSLYGEFPPANATRLHIEEEKSAKPENKEKKEKKISKKDMKTKINEKQTIENTKSVEASSSTTNASKSAPKTKPIEYDLSDLIKPNRFVKNKLATAAAALSNMKTAKPAKQQPSQPTQTLNTPTFPSELRLPNDACKASGKILIQEL